MRRCVLVLYSLVLVLGVWAQHNLYVLPSGNNGNTGTFSSPYKTIQYGCNQLQPGDTLNILAGTYNEKISINNSGTTNVRITIRAYQGQQVTISGIGITSQDAIIAIADKANINIIGLEIANNIQNDAQGIAITGMPQHITIANCKIHDIHFSADANAAVGPNTNAQGIIVYGNTPGAVNSNILIKDNELYNCRLGYSEGIAINGNIDGFEVSGNYVHNITNIGIDAIGHEGTCHAPAFDQARHGLIANNRVHDCLSPYATSAGIYIDGARAVIIERNICYRNGYGIEVGCENVDESADSITVRSNFIYNNEIAGIALGGYDYPSGSGKVMNTLVESNTLFMNDYNNSGTGELMVSYVEAAKIYSNIIYATVQNIIFNVDVSGMNINMDHNVYYAIAGVNEMEFYFHGSSYTGLADYQIGANQDQHSKYAIPAFVNATLPTPDLHLQANSACINNGVNHSNNSPQLDIDGEPRFNGTIDVGADEYYTGTNVEDVTAINVNVYPNPAVDVCYIQTENLEHVELYDIDGHLLQVQQLNTINLQALANGVYYLRIYTKQGVANKHIVKAFDGQ